MASNDRIYQQIENDADYYLPSLYERLLTFHHSLSLQTDRLGQEFIPISDAFNNPDSDKKLFVVGLIPPSSQVTGRLLDRSNTIASVDRIATDPIDLTPTGSVLGVPGTNQGPPIMMSLNYQQVAVAVRDAYAQRFQRQPTQLELATMVSQSRHETAGGQWPNFNPGGIGNFPAGYKDLGKIQTFGVHQKGQLAYYYSYPSAQAGAVAFVNQIFQNGGQRALDAAQAGDKWAYAQALHDGKYFTDTVENYANGMEDSQAVAQKLGDPSALNPRILPAPLALGPKGLVAGTGVWASQGSAASGQNVIMTSIAANRDINTASDTGPKFMRAQRAINELTERCIGNMAKTPPLQFIVNPQSFKVTSEHVIADGNWTRYGPADVVEHWGDAQDKVEASGKIAAFYAIDAAINANGPGLTRTARQYSASYQNFLSLYHLYRNNGGLYIPDPTDARTVSLSVVGSVYIYYDHTIYIGSFDTFSISETDTSPYTLEYSLAFTVRASFGLDQVQDPNYTYNIPQGGFTVAQPPIIGTQIQDVPDAAPSPLQIAAETAHAAALTAGATQGQAQAAAIDAAANASQAGGASFDEASRLALMNSLSGG